MSSQYALRVKTKSGPQLIKHLGPTSTIKDLKAGLSAVSNISENRLHVLSGFPPRAFDLTQDDKCLKDSGLSSGDTLILEEKPLPAAASSQEKPPKKEQNASENINKLEYPGILMKKVVPADNSCLFSSFHFALNGNLDGSSKTAPMLREMIAGVIAADPESYSEAVLGRPNSEYCAWIQNDKSWGGAIEVSILSQYQGLEIVVVDTINAIINRFGEDQQYGTRILLLYDGIHYDPLYLDPMDDSKIQTIFPTDDDKILEQAQTLAEEANSSRQFTNVDKFTLKCMTCNIFLTGHLQANEHAQKTGHANFGEV